MPFDRFLRRALAAARGLDAGIDVVGVHPYSATPDAALERLGWARGVVDAAGLQRTPLSVNEFGWPTIGAGTGLATPEPERAEAVGEVTAAIAGSSCDVIALALHTWITPETNPADPESWYGVADPVSGEQYPTAETYAARVQAIIHGEPLPLAGAATYDPCADRRAQSTSER